MTTYAEDHEASTPVAAKVADPIYDETLTPKHRKALVRQRLAQIDVEIVHLNHEKANLRELHASIK